MIAQASKANKWHNAATGCAVAAVVICSVFLFFGLLLFLIGSDELSHTLEEPGYAAMVHTRIGSGLDIMLAEIIFGPDPSFSDGVAVTLLFFAAAALFLCAASTLFVISLALLIKLERHSLQKPARFWIAGVAVSIATMRPITAALFTVAALLQYKSIGVSPRAACYTLAGIATVTATAVLGCFIYSHYVDAETAPLMDELNRVAAGDVYDSPKSAPSPYSLMTPDRRRDGAAISQVKLSRRDTFLFGDMGTIGLNIRETYDKGKSDMTSQNDFVRLWLQKIDGEWRIVDFYYHP